MSSEWRWVHAIVPVWIVTGVLLFPSGLAYLRGPVRRGLRARRNHCVGCGYSLAGNLSGVCPECGAAHPTRGLLDGMPMTI